MGVGTGVNRCKCSPMMYPQCRRSLATTPLDRLAYAASELAWVVSANELVEACRLEAMVQSST